MKKNQIVEYPKMVYDINGESLIVNSSSEIPEGFGPRGGLSKQVTKTPTPAPKEAEKKDNSQAVKPAKQKVTEVAPQSSPAEVAALNELNEKSIEELIEMAESLSISSDGEKEELATRVFEAIKNLGPDDQSSKVL